MSQQLTVNIDGRKGAVDRAKYVTAKTKQLREFGYSDLTEPAVDEQIGKILAGEKLDVIGMFMKDEIVAP